MCLLVKRLNNYWMEYHNIGTGVNGDQKMNCTYFSSNVIIRFGKYGQNFSLKHLKNEQMLGIVRQEVTV